MGEGNGSRDVRWEEATHNHLQWSILNTCKVDDPLPVNMDIV